LPRAPVLIVGTLGAGAAAVGRQHRVGLQQRAVALDERAQRRAARFFLAFEKHLDVHGARALHREECGDHFERDGGRAFTSEVPRP
jgi:hypothetical protein